MINKFLTYACVAGLLILLLQSCQKNFTDTSEPHRVDSTTNNDTVVIKKNDSTLLKLYVKLDTLLAPSQDTVYKMQFGYDNLKRLISFDYFESDLSKGGASPDIYHIKLEYKNTDTLPVKVSYQSTLYPDWKDTIATVYENGRLTYTKHSNLQRSGDSMVVRRTYSGDSDITIATNYGIPGNIDNFYYLPFRDTVYETSIQSNGNVSANESTIITVPIGAGPGAIVSSRHESYNNSFDTHLNPFRPIYFVFNLFALFDLDPFQNFSYNYIMAKSSNNIITSNFIETQYQTVVSNKNSTKTYVYNVNDLPLFSSYIYEKSAGKELYFYTK